MDCLLLGMPPERLQVILNGVNFKLEKKTDSESEQARETAFSVCVCVCACACVCMSERV